MTWDHFSSYEVTRRRFLAAAGATLGAAACGGVLASAGSPADDARLVDLTPEMAALRREIVQSPVRVAFHRAQTFTKVFRQSEGQPWIVRKAMALREYFQTVPLYLRPHDRLAGAISEFPGAMPVMVELGIGENSIYVSERPDRKGHLDGQVPEEIRDYWKNQNLWGHYRTEILGQPPVKNHAELPAVCPNYKFLSNQGHLSPSYRELLRVGSRGLRHQVQARREN